MRRTIESCRRLRGLALACIALLPATQVATFVHLGTVQHTTCPEHGELLEAAAVSGTEAPAQPNSVSAASAPAAESHAHDHCLFACHLRQGAERGAAIAALGLPQAQPAPSLAPPAAPAAGPARLRVAPKQSPPSA